MTSTALKTVRDYFNAWNSNNFEKAASCLSEHIVIETPINSYSTKNQFMEAVKFTAEAVSSLQLLAEFGNKDEAILLYDMTLSPIGSLRIAEYFKVEDEKITMIRHIHDTAEMRKAGFERKG